MNTLKTLVKKQIRKFESGDLLILGFKELTGRVPIPDMKFPELIGIEICSSCNLSCIHCPPQTENDSPKHGMMNFELFLKLMDEIDLTGKRNIALHKDGEPLLYPKIFDVLKRLKQNIDHQVYLTTNAHKLKVEIAKAILDSRLNIINFSIGAATEAFYNKVRGKNLERVTENILRFIELSENYTEKPGIQVQIINLPEFPEMKEEIDLFKNFWSAYDVKINVWDKLTWGLYDDENKVSYRYPCYSLWNSLEVNYNGTVSACCIDWKHQLIIGNANADSLNSIWHSKEIRNLRTKHIEDNGVSIDACNKCNYWHWQPRLSSYPLDDFSSGMV